MPEGRSFTQIQEEYAEFFGRAAALYNINPLLGRLYGYLVLAPEPMTLSDLSRAAGAAKSTVSVAMRNLEHYRVIRRYWKKGDRRDYFAIRTDTSAVLKELFQLFFSHELKYMKEANETARAALASSSTGEDWPTDDQREDLLDRIGTLEDFVTLVTSLLEQTMADSNASAKPAETVEIEVEK